MLKSKIKEQILTMLGSPYVKIEIENNLEAIIDKAFFEVNPYIDTPHYQTITVAIGNASCHADLSSYNVRAIQYIMRATMNYMNASENTNSMLWDPMTAMMTQSTGMNMGQVYSQYDFLKDYSASMRYRQLRNTLNGDLDYTYDSENQQIYVFQQVPQASQLTLVYNKDYQSVEEVKDPFWVNLILRLSLAYAKIVTGRVRGKYKMTSSPYELDAETLLAEGNAELSEIQAFLNDNNNIFIPRD